MKFTFFIKINFLLIAMLLFLCPLEIKAQLLPPPKSISITKAQDLSFGNFTNRGADGSVTVSPLGIRTTSGGVLALNLGGSFHQAIFNVSASVGTVISILLPPDVTLNGSNGGTMILKVDTALPISPFITTQISGITQVNVGGTILVKSLVHNAPGNYSGNFNVILVNQ
jgi:hypothetical protein